MKYKPKLISFVLSFIFLLSMFSNITLADTSERVYTDSNGNTILEVTKTLTGLTSNSIPSDMQTLDYTYQGKTYTLSINNTPGESDYTEHDELMYPKYSIKYETQFIYNGYYDITKQGKDSDGKDYPTWGNNLPDSSWYPQEVDAQQFFSVVDGLNNPTSKGLLYEDTDNKYNLKDYYSLHEFTDDSPKGDASTYHFTNEDGINVYNGEHIDNFYDIHNTSLKSDTPKYTGKFKLINADSSDFADHAGTTDGYFYSPVWKTKNVTAGSEEDVRVNYPTLSPIEDLYVSCDDLKNNYTDTTQGFTPVSSLFSGNSYYPALSLCRTQSQLDKDSGGIYNTSKYHRVKANTDPITGYVYHVEDLGQNGNSESHNFNVTYVGYGRIPVARAKPVYRNSTDIYNITYNVTVIYSAIIGSIKVPDITPTPSPTPMPITPISTPITASVTVSPNPDTLAVNSGTQTVYVTANGVATGYTKGGSDPITKLLLVCQRTGDSNSKTYELDGENTSVTNTFNYSIDTTGKLTRDNETFNITFAVIHKSGKYESADGSCLVNYIENIVNEAPTCEIFAPKYVHRGTTFHVTGTSNMSSDPSLQWEWGCSDSSQCPKNEGGNVKIDNTPISFSLRVVTETEGSLTAHATTIPTNNPPQAFLRLPDTVTLGDNANLEALMQDPDGDTFTYKYDTPSDMTGKDTLTEKGGTVSFNKVGKAIINVTVTDCFGASSTATCSTNVVAPIPKADLKINGTLKQNRKITADASRSTGGSENCGIDWTKTKFLLKPVDSTVSLNDIKTLENNSIQNVNITDSNGVKISGQYVVITDSSKQLKTVDYLVKNPGKIEVTAILTNVLGYTITATTTETNVLDEAPTAAFSMPQDIYRSPDDISPNGLAESTSTKKDESSSPDEDTIGKRMWLFAYDSDDDGSFIYVTKNEDGTAKATPEYERWYVYDESYNGDSDTRQTVQIPDSTDITGCKNAFEKDGKKYAYINDALNPHWRYVGNYYDAKKLDINSFNCGNETTVSDKSTSVGKYDYEEVVQEEFGQETIPQLITNDDKEKGDTWSTMGQ
jgi:hypothetical protein